MRHLLATCLVLGLSAAALHADVLVVDGTTGPGHYATVQAAVDAAAPGDTILVDVTLDTFTQTVVLDGKGVAILADTPDEDVALKKLTVRNVPAGQRATLHGLVVLDPTGVAMEFEDNAGSLRLYDVRAVGRQGVPATATQTVPRDGSTGVLFTGCDDVMLRDCGFGGGDGGDIAIAGDIETSDGGIGGVMTDSRISGWFTGFAGGTGGNVPLLSELAGGAGGESADAPDGPAGTGAQIQGGTTTELASTTTFARDLWAAAPLREGEAVELVGIGFEDHVWVVLGLTTGHQLLPGYEGTLMLAPPFVLDLHYLGYVPFLASTFPLGTVPELPGGLDVLEVHLQGVMLAGGGGFMLTVPDHLVLLDASY